LVSPNPYDVHRPSGIQLTCHPFAEASGGPPWTSAPLQSASPGTRAVPPTMPAWQTTLPLVDFLHPTTQFQAGGYVHQRQIPPPLRGHVRGLVTPLAALTSGPPDAEASERPWALPFKVFPSSQSVPLSGSMPSGRYPLSLASPRGGKIHRGRLQGLDPATSPFCHRNHE
jgi:hypothetical protein